MASLEDEQGILIATGNDQRERAEAEKHRADTEKQRADLEKQRADQAEHLRRLGIEPNGQ